MVHVAVHAVAWILALFPTSIRGASDSCGLITFTTPHGPVYREPSGNLTTPEGNTTALSDVALFSIGNDQSLSLSVYGENNAVTVIPCTVYPQFHCAASANTTTNNSSSAGTAFNRFTIGSDGYLYVGGNRDWYLATKYDGDGSDGPPFPYHLYSAFAGMLRGNWGFSTVVLKANGCYKGHEVDGQVAPTPTISAGSASVAQATSRPGPALAAAAAGYAALGLAALL